jgi:hypothetical protein
VDLISFPADRQSLASYHGNSPSTIRARHNECIEPMKDVCERMKGRVSRPRDLAQGLECGELCQSRIELLGAPNEQDRLKKL